MTREKNISITERAAVALRHEVAAFEPRAGQVFALVYMFSFTNPDGTTVDGFRPGFMAGSWPKENVGPTWVVAELADGTQFYFRPRRVWQPHQRYLMDLVGRLFSIEPTERGE